ncbi:hypothetical protein [Virgisporangium ochraceum]|uniref:hypothetical protein n=1 Tax=Virgisporangium ochraceum TaxID=65505 RepID=UPI0019456890|nr:hypothetical protein [Virgisporangium ochraceum]
MRMYDQQCDLLQDEPVDDRDLVNRLIRCIDEDNHAYAYVSYQFGGEALLDSHLPMLDLIQSLAREWQAMERPTTDTQA